MSKFRKFGIFLGIFFFMLFLYGCSGGGGSDETSPTPTKNYGSSSLSGVITDSSTRSVRGNGNGVQGTVSLIVDLDGDGTYNSTEDKTYNGVIQNNAFSFTNVIVKEKGITNAKLTIKKDGCAPYEKIVELEAGGSLQVKAQVNPVEKVTVNIPRKRDGGYIIFGIKKEADGSQKAFAKRATRAVSINGTEAQVAVPINNIPEEVEKITASLKLFNSGNKNDLKQFPGEFKGTGYPLTKADTDVVQLKSIAFLYAEFSDQNGSKVNFVKQEEKRDGTCSNLEVTLNVPNSQIDDLIDDVPNNGQYDVPIWRYNPNTGIWEYITEGQLFYQNGTSVKNNATLSTKESYYVIGCLPPGWTYCNLDYGVWLGEQPKQVTVCIKAVDQNNDPVPGVWIEARGQSDAGNTFVDSSTDNNGNAKLKISIPGNVNEINAIEDNYNFYWYYSAYGWTENKIDLSNLQGDETSGCDYYLNIQINNPFNAKLKVSIKDSSNNPLANKWITVYDENYYYKSKQTGSNGEAIFNVKSYTQYYISTIGQNKRAMVNNNRDYDEVEDNGNLASVEFQKLSNVAPKVSIYLSPSWPVKAGTSVTAYIYSWDSDQDNLTLQSAKLVDMDLKDKCTPVYSYEGYAQWKCIIDTTDLDAGDWTFTTKISDGKATSTKSASLTISENRPPQIYGINIQDKNQNYIYDWTNLKTNTEYTFIAYAWDPDGDSLNYSWKYESATKVAGNSSEKNTHAFTSEGNYTVTVTVCDYNENPKCSTYSINVHVGNTPPKIYAAGTTTVNPELGGEINVFAIAEDPDGTLNTNSFTWEIDGQPVDPQNPSYSDKSYSATLTLPFSQPNTGYFLVSLTVTDADGKTTTEDFKVLVGSPSNVTDAMALFIRKPTEQNYDNLLDLINNLPESKENHLWKATATLMMLYRDNQTFFNNIGINLNSDINDIKIEDVIYKFLKLASYDQNLKTVLDDIINKLDSVISDLTQAEGINTSITLNTFDTIYFDNLDVKIMEFLVKMTKAVCLYLQTVDFNNITDWTIDGTDIREMIKNGSEITTEQFMEILNKNTKLLTYVNKSKLTEFKEAISNAVDSYKDVIEILKGLTQQELKERYQNAFNLDTDEQEKLAEALNKSFDSFISAMENSNEDLVIFDEKDVKTQVIDGGDGYYYPQNVYDIYLYYYKPLDNDITVYNLINGNISPRDILVKAQQAGEEYSPYILDTNQGTNGSELFAKNVVETDWSHPIKTYSVSIASISVEDNSFSDWDSVDSFYTNGNLDIKIARSNDNQYFYVYVSGPDGFGERFSTYFFKAFPYEFSKYFGLSINYYNGSIDAHYYNESTFEDINPSDIHFDNNKVEVKFPKLNELLEKGGINGFYIDQPSGFHQESIKLLPEIEITNP
ncbi:PKD domain-containing protein [Desulfothermus naphthae]